MSSSLGQIISGIFPAFRLRLGVKGIIAIILALAFPLFLLDAYHWKKSALALVALGIGAAFFHYRLSFSHAWRALTTRAEGSGLRAQMLWIGLAALPFAWLTTGENPTAIANIRPLTTGVAVGALLFGIGMQLNGSCLSGSVVGAGRGSGALLISLLFFIIGALIAAAHIEFWRHLPAAEAFSLYQQWGIAGGLTVAAASALIIWGIGRLPATASATTAGFPSWTIGALLIACLSVLILLLAGQPWGFLNGLTILGAKILFTLRYEDIEFWEYWSRFASGPDFLHEGWFAGNQLITTVGVLLGALLAAVISGRFALVLGGGKRLLLAIIGGLLMGYGAQISYGCNIGSYMSALSSGSAHGVLWIIFALIGTLIALPLRRLAGLSPQ